MKLYLLSQSKNTGYDTYDCAVVIAENEELAAKVPVGSFNGFCTWVAPEFVTVKYIGEAVEGLKGELNTGEREAIICASFNAG